MLLEEFNQFQLLFSLEGLLLVGFLLNFVPSLLDCKAVLGVVKENGLVLEVLLGFFDGHLEAHDRVLKELLSLGESLVLLLEVGALHFPVLGLALLRGQQGGSGGNQLLSDLGQELQDVDDRLVVNLGGQLGQSGDEGLVEGVLSFGELGGHLLEAALQLGEGNTSLEVLHDLAGFIDGFDLVDVSGILLDPDCVLVLSGLALIGKALLVVGDIGGHDTDFAFSLSKGFAGRLDQVAERDDLGLVVGDFLFEVLDELGEGGGVSLVNLVSLLLVVVQLGSNVVEQDLDLSDGSTSLEMQLQDGKDCIAKVVAVDLSQHLPGIFSLVSVPGEGQGD